MKVDMTERTFRRLQKHAVPLRDNVEDVIVKLLDAYEAKKKPETANLDDLLPRDFRQRRKVAGFAGELLNLILTLPEEFSLAEVYRNMGPLKKQRPHVKELEASVRAALQTLRDAGHLQFLDNRGQYRRVES